MSLRRLPGWAFTLLAAIPVLPLALVARQLDANGMLTVTVVVLAWALGWLIYGWTRLDEASREAYKFAWFWGGATGLVLLQFVGFAGLLVPSFGKMIAAYVESEAKPEALVETSFIMGVFAACFIQVIGFTLVWAVWWLSRRIGR